MNTHRPIAAKRRFRALQQSYGAVVRQLRLNAGFSGKKLAQESKISRSQLRRIETGQGNPTISAIVNIAAALGTRASRMFKQVQEMKFNSKPKRRTPNRLSNLPR